MGSSMALGNVLNVWQVYGKSLEACCWSPLGDATRNYAFTLPVGSH